MQIPGMSEWRANDLWDTVCFIGAAGEQFKSRTVIECLVRDGWKPKTAELSWSKFKLWAIANPDEFHGPVSRLQQVRNGYILADNPE